MSEELRETKEQAIVLSVNGGIARLIFNKPPVNALDEPALKELMDAIIRVQENPEARVLIVASGIKEIFCAGGDMKFWPSRYPVQGELVGMAGRRVFERLKKLPIPTIAAIRGRTIGDGLALALACDIRLASMDSTFHLPELDYGFIPGWGTIGGLLALVGRSAAAEMLLCGEPMSAERAEKLGLVNRVVPDEAFMVSIEQAAAGIARKSVAAARSAKAVLLGGAFSGVGKGPDLELSCFASAWGSEDWRKGMERILKPRVEKS